MRLLFLVAYVCPLIAAQMCVQCVPGKYRSNSVFTQLCENCALNTYTPSHGMTACQPCPANSSSVVGSSTCTCVRNYVKAVSSNECFFECATGLVPVRGGCECPVGTSGPPNGPCVECAVHTYASQVDTRTCTACPEGMRSVVGSVSIDACMCGVGFVKDLSGTCNALSDVSVVLKFEVVVALPPSVTAEDLRKTILQTVSVAYNISAEYLVVDIVFEGGGSGRRLMQTGRYTVTVRILFQSGASLEYVNATQTQVGVLGVNVLNAGILLQSTTALFNVSTVTLQESRDEKGVFNANSQTIVSCDLLPWLDELGEAQACVLTCLVNEDVYAVVYLEGVYVLGCRPKPDKGVVTAARTSTPAPTQAAATMDGSGIAIAGGVVGGVVSICVIACIIYRTGKGSANEA